MQRIIRNTLAILLLLTAPAYAGGAMGLMMAGGASAPACNDCTGKLLCQNFEGAGYDNTESYTESPGAGGSIDEEDTTATILRGSQQLKVYSVDSNASSVTSAAFSATSPLYTHFLFKKSALPSTEGNVFQIKAGSTVLCNVIAWRNGSGQEGKLYVQAAGGTAQTHGTVLSNDTPYHIWVEYTADSGANDASCKLNIGTSTTNPGATNQKNSNNGTQDGTPTVVSMWARYAVSHYFDQLIVDDAPIETVCP